MIQFSRAQAHEAAEVYQIIRDAIEEMFLNGIDQWNETYPCMDDVRADLARQELFLGRIGGVPAAVFVLNEEADEEYSNGRWQDSGGRWAVLHRFCVSPRFQRRGVGSRVLTSVETIAAQAGYTSLRLDAMVLNPLP